jgi:hypothetical protein
MYCIHFDTVPAPAVSMMRLPVISAPQQPLPKLLRRLIVIFFTEQAKADGRAQQDAHQNRDRAFHMRFF